MQTIRIDSEQIKLPIEVVKKLKGKEIQFIESQSGFVMQPVSDPIKAARGFLKRSRFSTERFFEAKQNEKRLE